MPSRHLTEARRVFDVELAAVRAVKQSLNAQFDRAVEFLVRALERRGKIVVVGMGKSGAVGRKIAATLTSTGSTSVVLNSVDALHGDVGIVNDGDVILALSYSGESDELLNLMPALKRFTVTLIAVTGGSKSTLARHSDVVLNVRVPKEACPFNLAPTASTTATLVMGDALAMAVLKARGFKQSDFARFHPSGAIGRAMLLRVGDIMRSGPRNAVAPQNIAGEGRVAGDDPCAFREPQRGRREGQAGGGVHRWGLPPFHGRGSRAPGAHDAERDDPAAGLHPRGCIGCRGAQDLQRSQHRRPDRREWQTRAGGPGGFPGPAQVEDRLANVAQVFQPAAPGDFPVASSL